MNGGHGDTPFNRENESPSACAREEPLFSNNEEQGHLVLSKSGTSSRRQIVDSRRGEISSGELYSSNMQSVAERTVFQKVPLAESDTAEQSPVRHPVKNPEMSHLKRVLTE